MVMVVVVVVVVVMMVVPLTVMLPCTARVYSSLYTMANRRQACSRFLGLQCRSLLSLLFVGCAGL